MTQDADNKRENSQYSWPKLFSSILKRLRPNRRPVPAAGFLNPRLDGSLFRPSSRFQSPATGWTVAGWTADGPQRASVGSVPVPGQRRTVPAIVLDAGSEPARLVLQVRLDPEFLATARFNRLELVVNSGGATAVIHTLEIRTSGLVPAPSPVQLTAEPLTATDGLVTVSLDDAMAAGIAALAAACRDSGRKLLLIIEVKRLDGKLAIGGPAFLHWSEPVAGLENAVPQTIWQKAPDADALAELVLKETGEEVLRCLLEARPAAQVVKTALELAIRSRAYFRVLDLGAALAASPDRARLDAQVLFVVLWAIGRACTRGMMGERALQALEEAARLPAYAKLAPEDAASFASDVARATLKSGRYEEAAAQLRRILEKYPRYGRALVDLSAITLRASDPHETLRLLTDDAIRSQRTTSIVNQLRHARADALLATGRADAAVSEILQASLGNVPSPVRAALQNSYLALGDLANWEATLLGWFPAPVSAAVSLLPQAHANVLTRLTSTPLSAASTDARCVVVIMTVFNAVDTLEMAVRSVLAQSHKNLRLIVVDDCSTDGSHDLLLAFARQDNRVLVMRNAKNSGTYVSKNQALKAVAGDYYTFHDSDDWMHPERVERHVAAMEGNPEAVISYSNWVRFDASGRVTIPEGENPASSFFARKLIDEIGYFDSVRAAADTEFRWRAVRAFGRHAKVPLVLRDVLGIGLTREGSLTTSGAAQKDLLGYNPIRTRYAEHWNDWQRTAEAAGKLTMPFPLEERPFPVDEENAAPPPELIPPTSPQNPDGGAPLVISWPAREHVRYNWGDKLSPTLVRMLTGRQPTHKNAPAVQGASRYYVIGSGMAAARTKDTVWGSGYISEETANNSARPRICAVRGPLTRAALLARGKDCPEIYGDPAVLLPLFYNPEVAPTYDIGIIQHCREAGLEPLPMFPTGLSVRLIDINGGIEEVVDAILSCRQIFSSSLHGLIAAHTYGVPATWIKFSDRPLGDGFKFKDYWASIGRDAVEPVVVGSATLDPTSGISTPGQIRIDLFALIAACPFIDTARKDELLARARSLAQTGRDGAIFRRHAGLGR